MPRVGQSTKDIAEFMDRFRNLSFTGQPRASRALTRNGFKLSLRPARGSIQAIVDSTPLSEAEMRFVRSVIAEACVDLSTYRLTPFRRRLAACLRALRVPTIEAAEGLLAQHPSLRLLALDALLIGVTKFFRDSDVFDQLRRRWLPQMLDACREPRVWSVGASDGAELYSVASLLAERGALGLSQLRGSDCRAAAIDLARRARYSAASLSDVPDDLRSSCFRPDGGAMVPSEMLACANIEWRVEDALACQEKAAWDLILCRNMAIYLESSSQVKLWSVLTAALKPGGIMVVGKAERPNVGGLRRVGCCTYLKDRD
jgi:chemotaxis methyl-accepting protein methylase